MKSEQINLTGGGAIGFTKNKFTYPPIVFLTSVRQNQIRSVPVIAKITGINKGGFGYYTK